MAQRKSYIISTGSYLPEGVLTNDDLEKMVETSDDWIVSRTGMKERRIAKEGEFTSDMGYFAAIIALGRAGLNPEAIDLIIVATLSPDYPFPSTACLIQSRLGASKAAAFDIQAACSGYIYALATAKSFIESGIYNNVLVIAPEKLSSIVDYQDRNTCILFGDGSAACIVSSEPKGLCIGNVTLGADGQESGLLMMPAGGCRNPPSQESVEKRKHYLQMDGKEIFKHAIRRMEQATIECLSRSGLAVTDISYLLPHQANIRIIEALAKRCHMPEERVVSTVDQFGNTSASSIGIGLDLMWEKGMIKKGERVLLVAFGAGLTWGALILTSVGKG